MPTEFDQLPGRLDIAVGLADDLSLLLTFSINLTGYTVSGAVVKNDVETAFGIANTDLTNGKVTISLTSAQITALQLGRCEWYLKWVVAGASRRVLAGDFYVKDETL